MRANALSKRNVVIGAAARLLLTSTACLPAFACAYASDPIIVNADRYRVDAGKYYYWQLVSGSVQ